MRIHEHFMTTAINTVHEGNSVEKLDIYMEQQKQHIYFDV